MDQSDDNSLTAPLMKRGKARFREIGNTCTERRAEKRIQRTAWILSHVLRKTLCEHVNGLCPAGWLNEQSITKHWFQSVRTCPYSWATGRNGLVSRDSFERNFVRNTSLNGLMLGGSKCHSWSIANRDKFMRDVRQWTNVSHWSKLCYYFKFE